jgi:hypothetical protein
MHIAAFVVLGFAVPMGHGRQSLLRVALPSVMRNWPGPQSVKGVQAVAMVGADVKPAVHPAHMGCVVASPCMVAKKPGLQ